MRKPDATYSDAPLWVLEIQIDADGRGYALCHQGEGAQMVEGYIILKLRGKYEPMLLLRRFGHKVDAIVAYKFLTSGEFTDEEITNVTFGPECETGDPVPAQTPVRRRRH